MMRINFHKNAAATAALLTAVVFGTVSSVHADDPPPDTHNNDFLMGRDQNFGTTGNGSAFWFSDAQTNPTRLTSYLAETHPLIPNITGPANLGNIYFNLGSNVVTVASGSPPVSRPVLTSATLEAVSATAGLLVEKFGQVVFSGNAADTIQNNRFNYPFSNSFHQHFNVRVYRPGTYTFSFHLINAVARDGTVLTPSPTYTLTLQNRPVMTSRITLPDWQKTDATEYQTGNTARVFIFSANSAPTSESQAVATTDVYLLPNGQFQIPEGLVADGNYRIGVKPLTAPGLSRLYPGNIALSAASPPTLPAMLCPLGDINRDGVIDEFDYNTLVQNFYSTDATSDVNGDGYVDEFDYNDVVQQFYNQSDFFP